MKKILTAFADNTVFANVVLILIFILGGIASVSMVCESFPEFSLDMITISVYYPGADPEEIEESISTKIEEAVDGVQGVKNYHTRSEESKCLVSIEVEKGYDLDSVLDNLRTNINSISTFPIDSEKPIIEELVLKEPVLMLYLSGDLNDRYIKELSYKIKDEIQNLPNVSRAKIFGDKKYEICVEISKSKLEKYNISISDIADIIRSNSLNLAGGIIQTDHEKIRIRTVERKYTGKDLSSIIVLVNSSGGLVSLDEIVSIRDDFEEEVVETTIDGNSAIMLLVYKTRKEDALDISNEVINYVNKKQKILPKSVNFGVLYDNTGMLKSRIKLLLKNGFFGLIIVFVSLWAFFNTKLSFWIGLGIPVSISGALAILWWLDGTINMVSLFGLIMVLGIVVDDAIVVGEAIYVARQRGEDPLKASVSGLMEVAVPVLTAVCTTIVAFIPLFYIGGIMGKFISILPCVVISCLVVSLIESVFLLPAHLRSSSGSVVLNKQSGFLVSNISKIHTFTRKKMDLVIVNFYIPILNKVLKWRYVSFSVAIALFLLTVGLLRSGILKFEVFPAIDGFIITSTVEFPNGTPLDVTKSAIDQIDEALMRLEKKHKTSLGESFIKHRLAIVGETLDDMPKKGSHLGSVQAILLESEKRGIHSDELLVLWEKETGGILGARSLKFKGLATGPPGSPIEIWIQSNEIDVLVDASEKIIDRLKKFSGVYQVRSDFECVENELCLNLKPKARYLGLTVEGLASQVFAGYYGLEAFRVQRGRDDIRVKVRYTHDERSSIYDFENMRIITPQGARVPLGFVANVFFKSGYSVIVRTNGMKRIAVSADVNTNKANVNEVLIELSKNYFPSLLQKYPDVFISIQGEQKKMNDSLGSLFVSFPIAIFGIFIIIATTFRSYLQPVIITITIPFGIVGAVIGHLFLGYDISIMSIFGMVALTGVVVNGAIVLIEAINTNIASGMSLFDAIVSGGSRRFKAIFLTTISTVGGLFPIIMERDLQAKVLIPMAISIAAGVAFASILTLFLVPSLFAILSDFRVAFYKFRYGKLKERELLEPAKNRIVDLS